MRLGIVMTIQVSWAAEQVIIVVDLSEGRSSEVEINRKKRQRAVCALNLQLSTFDWNKRTA